ncbi:TIGR00730 family Rossman fold protein [Aestuariivirga litoralis]|uniref:LOG family protein n=1 Tax=Aestuariivirga litoralis TaxID=2650924 RepID=UPI0018C4F43C|nr:TIGR00730 family Rossman fold protein [Aestuariivirga litoralis]MBG1232078.1 TIGR00730 family Rossman fold protein [Aestuariivirga litoralis]
MTQNPRPIEHRLCVYCGSSPGRNPSHMKSAIALGTAMARAGIGLVYGGGSIGLMGATAQAVLDAGGHVTGIIPEFLVAKERMLDGVNELVVTRSMHERKTLMFERSTGFVALPGGIGTLEELAEITTWAQLNQHAKPIIVADFEGYWEHLLKLLDHMRAEQFIRAETEVFLDVAKTVDEVVPLYHARLGQARQKVPLAAIRQQL